jgi:hypothetical protein
MQRAVARRANLAKPRCRFLSSKCSTKVDSSIGGKLNSCPKDLWQNLGTEYNSMHISNFIREPGHKGDPSFAVIHASVDVQRAGTKIFRLIRPGGSRV